MFNSMLFECALRSLNSWKSGPSAQRFQKQAFTLAGGSSPPGSDPMAAAMGAGGAPPPPGPPPAGGGADPMAALLGGGGGGMPPGPPGMPPMGGDPLGGGMGPPPSGGADPLAALLGGSGGGSPAPGGSPEDIRNIVREEISKALGGSGNGNNGAAVEASGKPVKKKGDILGDLLKEQVRIRKLLVHLVNSLNVGMPDNILDDDDQSVSSSSAHSANSASPSSDSSSGDQEKQSVPESSIKPIEPIKPAFVQGKQASAPVLDRAEALLRMLHSYQEFI